MNLPVNQIICGDNVETLRTNQAGSRIDVH